MVISNTVVEAILLNVLWHTSQKCRLTQEDKKEHESKLMYVCTCLCGSLCLYDGFFSRKHHKKYAHGKTQVLHCLYLTILLFF